MTVLSEPCVVVIFFYGQLLEASPRRRANDIAIGSRSAGRRVGDEGCLEDKMDASSYSCFKSDGE